MDRGVQAEFAVTEPGACQIAESAADASVSDITRSSVPVDGEVVEEFAVDADERVVGATGVYDHGGERRYRLSREFGQGCVCERIERRGVPVHRVSVDRGTLVVVVHLDDVADVRDLVADLRETFDGVSLRRLVRGRSDGDRTLVLPDGSELTEKQYDALETAHRLGYFDHPKDANAGEVAAHLDISRTSFTERLSAAQSKLFEWLLRDPDFGPQS